MHMKIYVKIRTNDLLYLERKAFLLGYSIKEVNFSEFWNLFNFFESHVFVIFLHWGKLLAKTKSKHAHVQDF